MRKTWISTLATATVAALALAACGGGDDTGSGDNGTPSGTITVLSNRTDLKQDGTLAKYGAQFHKLYPKVTVKFQAITDYAGEVKTRLNTDEYGDVLLIPPSVARPDYPKFFEPLGDASSLDKKYNWVRYGTSDGTANGKAYGLATFGNANGFVYNKRIWREAGVTSAPTTPKQFLAALRAIKDKTDAVPYYTNYHDGWPVQGWNSALGSPSCDTGANVDMASDKSAFGEDKDPGKIYGLLFDIVKNKLIEDDPTTTNWENSKALLGTGKAATMWLGSWAMTQMQAAAKTAKADPADIGFLPYPAQSGGKFCSVTAPDYLQAINKHSDHKAAARAWVNWFTDKSGFAKSQGSLATRKGAARPSTLADYSTLGVRYIELDQSKAAKVSKIDTTSEVGFFAAANTAQRVIDVGRGSSDGTLKGILDDLDKKWADGIDSAG